MHGTPQLSSMNKRINCAIAIIAALFLSPSIFSQDENFDIATYTPPSSFKKELRPGAVNYVDVNKAAGTFCVLTMYASTRAGNSEQQDFNKAWTELAVDPYKAAKNPTIELSVNQGWKIITGAAIVKSEGVDVTLVVCTISGFGKTMSIRTSMNSDSYSAVVEEFFNSLNLSKASVPNVEQGGTLPSGQAIGSFGQVRYNAPAKWSQEKFDDGVVFKPLDIPAGDHIAIQVMKPLNTGGSIEQALETSFAEATVMYNGSSMYQSGGKYGKYASVISFTGWEYIRGKGGIRIKDGTQFGTEYGLELFVIKVNNRFERVAILESRKYCNGASLYYAGDRRVYRNAVESFLFSLHFADFNGKTLSPGSINGNGVVGLWQGTIQSTTASGVKLEVVSPIFLSNGQVHFGSTFPLEGLNGINSQIPPQLNNRDWGTYTFSNGNGVIKMPYGNIPFKKEGDQLTLIKNKTNWPFYQLPSVDGAVFSGVYRLATVNGKTPSISFTVDGQFADNGALKELYHEYITCLNPATLPGGGRYEVKDYSITFHYNDGRKVMLAFLGAGYKKGDTTPGTLRISYNEDLLTRQ